MLKKAYSLLLHELVDHITKHSSNGIEALVSLADVCEANIVEENLLHDKNSNSLA